MAFKRNPNLSSEADVMAALDEAFDVSETLNLGATEEAPVMEKMDEPAKVEEPVVAPAETFAEKLRRKNRENAAYVQTLFGQIERAVTEHDAKEFTVRLTTPPYILKACEDAGLKIVKGEEKITLTW